MRIPIQAGGQQLELVRCEHAPAADLASTGLRASVALVPSLLRQSLSDPLVISQLRSLLQLRVRSGKRRSDDDHDLVEEVARRISRGEFVLVARKLKNEAIPDALAAEGASTPSSSSATAAEPSPAVADVPATSEEPQRCTNPACQEAFEDAAEEGTPLVESGAGSGC